MYFSGEINYFLQCIVEFIYDGIAALLYFLTPFLKPIVAVIFKSTGIEIDGNNAWDIKVRDNRFYGLIIAKGVTGFFDAFVEGYIDCDDLENTLMKITVGSPFIFHLERYHPYRLLKYFIHTYFDALTSEAIRNVINEHYDNYADHIKEAFDSTAHYSTMLLYDCNAVEVATTEQIKEMLEKGTFLARENIAKKLKLEPGMKVLDIGCGFGGLAKHLAERYKVEVTGVTICKGMAEHARKVCKGLPVKIILDDYRAVTGEFDRIVSIEMFEHIGETHHREYFKKVNSLLADDGIFVFQAHHCAHDYIFSYTPMIEKSLEMYCYFPRLEEIAVQSRGLMVVEDIQNLGYCFGVTCKAVLMQFDAKKESFLEKASIKEYRRCWIYGCLGIAMGLSGRDRVYQIVFSKNGLRYGYQY